MPQDTRHQKKTAGNRRQPQPMIVGAVVLAVLVAGLGILLTRNGDTSSTSTVTDTTGSGAAADAAVTWTAEPFAGGPRLAVDQREVDHGSVGYGHEVQAVYRLKNVGDAPLQLGAIRVETLEGC